MSIDRPRLRADGSDPQPWTLAQLVDDAVGGEEPTEGAHRPSGGVAGNARLTGSTAVLLLVLLAAEGFTLLAIGRLITAHVFIGMLLLPPVGLKLASTGWKIVRYYAGDRSYRRAGPPPVVRRLLGPLVMATTAAVLASGVALVLAGPGSGVLLGLHKVSFVAWFLVMTAHVLLHLVRTVRAAAAEWLPRAAAVSAGKVRGRPARRGLVIASVALGLGLGVVSLSWLGPWHAWLGAGFGGH